MENLKSEQEILQGILYEDEFIRMYFDENLNAIVKDWKKEVSSDKFREIIIHLLMQIIQVRMSLKHRDVNIFVDGRKIGTKAFSLENMAWLDKDIHPLYVRNKIAKKVFFVSDNSTDNESVAQYIKETNAANTGLQMNIFTDEEKSKTWLMI